MRADKTMLIMAGGTGGHVYPALAVALELQQRGFRVCWLGAGKGLENRVAEQAGLTLCRIAVRGLRGKGPLARAQGLLILSWAALQSLVVILRIWPVCVLGMGGYVSGPAGLTAWLLRRPLVIHEQNSVAGTTNRLLSRLATRILTAYPGAFANAEVVGNPLRRELLRSAESSSYDYDGSRPLRLLVVGGSLGARALNEVMPAALQQLPSQCRLQIRHQTGEADADRVGKAYAALEDRAVEVFPYIEDMAAVYLWCDLVLCRAGALTLAELTVMGRPAILVPLPDAIDDHQAHNADWLRSRGAALVLPQAEMNAVRLANLLFELQEQPLRLADMASAARRTAFKHATRRVADVCEEVSRV